jgi:ABC-type branched-subunit amino acid transport system substrate-binding protein
MGAGAEGWVEAPGWEPGLRFPGAEKFERGFVVKSHTSPTHDAAWAYAADDVLRRAIERAGTLDRHRVLDVLHREKFTTINGTYKWDATGRLAEFLVPFGQIQGGKLVIVWPPSVATANPILGTK